MTFSLLIMLFMQFVLLIVRQTN